MLDIVLCERRYTVRAAPGRPIDCPVFGTFIPKFAASFCAAWSGLLGLRDSFFVTPLTFPASAQSHPMQNSRSVLTTDRSVVLPCLTSPLSLYSFLPSSLRHSHRIEARASSPSAGAIALLILLKLAASPQHTVGQCIVTVVGPLSIEGTPATTQQISNPYGVAVDETNGGYVIADATGHTLRHTWPNGSMTTILGVWRQSGVAPDGPVSSSTLLSTPTSVITDRAGGYIFCDRANAVVRRLYANGAMVRVAGNLTGRFFPQDGPATSIPLTSPSFLSLESSGGLWISDQGK